MTTKKFKKQNRKYLSTETAAKVLCKSEGTLNNMRFYGTGPRYIKMPGLRGHVLYDIKDLIKWMDDHKVIPENEIQRMSKQEPDEQGSKIQGLPYNSDLTALAVELDLHTTERHLLYLLRSKMNGKQKSCWPSQKQLATEIGISERQVKRLIQSLTRKKIISIGKRKKNKKYKIHNQNEYQFIFPWNTE